MTAGIKSRQPVKENSSKWHALAAGWLGESFDAMDASIYFIALYPAMAELLRTKSDVEIGWIGSVVLAVFMLGWAVGGILFGMLADKIGRTKTMVVTILVYSVATGLCALSHSWVEMAIYRFFVGCGIGGEICLGTVIIGEFWSGKARPWATAALESSFCVGVMLASGANFLVGEHSWRWLFVIGLVPALVTLYIRAKLKEPEAFEEMKKHKTGLRNKRHEHLSEEERHLLKHPFKQLFAPETRRKIICTVTLASAAIIGYWACVSWIPPWVNQLTGNLAVNERSLATTLLSVGGLLGAAITPLMLIWIGRRATLKIGFGTCLIATLAMFLTVKAWGPALLAWVFFIGAVVSIQFVTICIYIPEAFKTSILATASGFTFSAGRVIAATMAICGGQLIAIYGGSYAYASATLSLIYGVGFIAAFFLPETNGEVAGTGLPSGQTRSARHAKKLKKPVLAK